MRPPYPDLLALSKKPPQWHDANGVPRFAPFQPSITSDLSSISVWLTKISCVHCAKEFQVEVNEKNEFYTPTAILKEIQRWKKHRNFYAYHYGNPPSHDGCIGETEECVDIRILQFFTIINGSWERKKKLEVRLS